MVKKRLRIRFELELGLRMPPISTITYTLPFFDPKT